LHSNKSDKKSEILHAIACDNSADFQVIHGIEAERLLQTVDVIPRANFRFNFPSLETVERYCGSTLLLFQIPESQ
jgi:fatty acid synthase subunit alpha, fungi type